jgi:hypothetical protein
VPTRHEQVVFDHTGITRQDLIVGSWPMVSKFSFLPGYFLAVDRQNSAIVLALRSSTTHRDWLTDLCGSYEAFMVLLRLWLWVLLWLLTDCTLYCVRLALRIVECYIRLISSNKSCNR